MGLRNRDVRRCVYGESSGVKRRKESGRVTRVLALLRAHGLVSRVPKRHRYQLTDLGRRVCLATMAAGDMDVKSLTSARLKNVAKTTKNSEYCRRNLRAFCSIVR